ncbi:MAG: hypothetical protein U9O20_01265 [Patescibacteria group bacterium]|nr:hypothetical protein [Patescibacteria group bacterium]
MTKKIFIVSAIIFAIAISALIVSKVFLSEKGSSSLSIDNPFSDDEDDDEKEVESPSDAVISKVLDREVKGVVLTGSSQLMFYNDQKVLSTNFEGKKLKSLGAYPFVKVRDFDWHPKNEKALVNDNGKYYTYFLKDNSAREFALNADVAKWDVFGDRVIYKKYDVNSSKRIIGVVNSSGEEQRTLVEDLPFKKVDFTVPQKKNFFCYFPTSDSLVSGNLICVDVKSNEQKQVHADSFGADYLLSPNGKKVLISSAQKRGGNKLILGVMSLKGAEFQGLNFSTSVKKCVWAKDSKHIFCGAINAIPGQAVMPNDWENKKYYSSDTFWKINTDNGKQTRLIDLEQTPGHLDGANYFLDEKEKNLFFIERKSGHLYKVSL